MSGPSSASKRARLLRAITESATRQAAGFQQGPIDKVPCHGRQGEGCGKRLADILYPPDAPVVFVVRAPYTLVAGVALLEKPGKLSYPAAVVTFPDGAVPTFGCPRCHKITQVIMDRLVAVAPRRGQVKP